MDLHALRPLGCRLVVVGIELGVRWSEEAAQFIPLLARSHSRAAPPLLRSSARAAYVARWSGLLSFAAARALAASLLSLPLANAANVDGEPLELSDLLDAASSACVSAPEGPWTHLWTSVLSAPPEPREHKDRRPSCRAKKSEDKEQKKSYAVLLCGAAARLVAGGFRSGAPGLNAIKELAMPCLCQGCFGHSSDQLLSDAQAGRRLAACGAPCHKDSPFAAPVS